MSTITNGSFAFSSAYKRAGYFSYDAFGNLVEQAKDNDVPTAYLWGYNNLYPVAKVYGASYGAALSFVNQATLQNMAVSDATVRNQVDLVRNGLSSAMVTSYTYKPMVGLTSEADVNNRVTYYEYDGLGQTSLVKDNDGNIVKNFKYNYGLGTAPPGSFQSLFYNAGQSGNFTKQNACNGGTYLPSITYTVPYGKYVSYLSQAAANSMAIQDLNTNGQTMANNLPCLYGNSLYRPFIQKNDCLETQGPGNIIRYTVSAGTFKAATQAEADQMAHDDALINGQTYANTYAGCLCGAEGQMYINGICETGQRINIGTYFENGQWRCVYYYQFSDRYTQTYESYSSSPCPVY
jgi:YD repeat-containing protein